MRDYITASSLLALLFSACATESDSLPSAPASELDALRTRASHTPWSEPVNVGAPPNAAFSEFDPFITKDGLSLYFVTGMGRPGFGMRDLWVSERATLDDPWSEPRNLGVTINSAVHEQHPMVSVDGHHLYFSSNRAGFGGFDLFVSRREDVTDNLGWGAPVNLGSTINGPADETGMTIARGLMYFSSSRLGGMDIYAAQARSGTEFGEARIVESLSTPFQDIDPAFSRDGREIFIGSDRTGTLGNIDVWVSTRNGRSHEWSPATNLGPTINTAFFDGGPSLSFDGRELYFQSAFRSGNVGGPMFDIWLTSRERVRGRMETNIASIARSIPSPPVDR